MSATSIHRGHRYNVLLRDESTLYLDAVDMVTGYEGMSAASKLHYIVVENCAWKVLDRPDLVVCCMWREASVRQNTVWIDRFMGALDMTSGQHRVVEEVARMEAAGEEVLAATLNNKTLAALRDRHELVIVHRGQVMLTSLGRHLMWLRDHPQPRRPAFGDPSIPPCARA